MKNTLFITRPTFLLNPSGGWWIHGQWELAGICCETKALAIRRPSSSFAMVRRRNRFRFNIYPFESRQVVKFPQGAKGFLFLSVHVWKNRKILSSWVGVSKISLSFNPKRFGRLIHFDKCA